MSNFFMKPKTEEQIKFYGWLSGFTYGTISCSYGFLFAGFILRNDIVILYALGCVSATVFSLIMSFLVKK